MKYGCRAHDYGCFTAQELAKVLANNGYNAAQLAMPKATLENVSKASEQAAGLILHNCPYSFRSYMLANYGPGLGQAMSALLASDYQDPYVLVSEIKDVPIVVTYQNTGRLPISEFNKFRKTELPNLSYIEFPAKAPAQTVNKEAEELRERIIKFFDTRTTS